MTDTEPRIAYAERLTVPWWWWALGVGVLAVLCTTVQLGTGIPAWIPFLALLPLPVWTLLWLGRHRLEVVSTGPDPAQTELRVGRAHLPMNFVSRAAAVPAAAKSAAMGRQLDPAAYVRHRPWIGPMTLLVLDDPDDPTPYWLISSRTPERLLAALGKQPTG